MAFLKKLFHRKVTTPAESYQVFFMCNECFEPIKDGSSRYNCVDCTKSYDLCNTCYSSGKAGGHTDKMGPAHTFVVESKSHVFTSTLVHKGNTLQELVLNMFKFYGPRPAVGQYDSSSNSYIYTTFNELFESVKSFGAGLKQLLSSSSSKSGGSQSMISMCSISRLEWYLTDLACLFLGIPTVPVGANSSKEQMRYILKIAEVSIVVCSARILKELVKVLPEIPSIQVVVLMDLAMTYTEDVKVCNMELPHSVRLVKFSEVMALGKERPNDLLKMKHKPDDIYTVQFTSGSTGDPKGCVFSRNTWKSRVGRGTNLGSLNVWLSFHPPSHNLERASFFVTLLNGGKTGIYRGFMEHLFDDFALVRPTVVASTPRLWTMLYNQYIQELHLVYVQHMQNKAMVEPTASGETESGAEAVSSIDLEHFDVEKVPYDLQREVRGRFKSKLGGRERILTTGGAPTGNMVKKFIMECFEGMVNDGYGSTEVGGIASDGSVLSTADIKLIDAPELGYFTTDCPPRGEICVKTPSMIDGYFKNPDATAQKFIDGYFLTGDIGVMAAGDKVRIIDRKKNIFKLAQGEFVSPERLEMMFVGASCCISQMYVYGNSLWSNILAIVVPESKEVLRIGKILCKESKDLGELCLSPEVKAEFMKEIQTIAKDMSLPGWEVPVDIVLEPSSFTVENGLLTSTLKKSRPRFEMKYKDLLEDMYKQMNSPTSHRPLEIVVFEWMRDQLHQGLGKTESFSNEGGLDCDMIQKSFSQLGGDSLAAMHLSSLLREHLSLELPVDVILKTPLADIPSGVADFKRTASQDWAEESSLDWLDQDTDTTCECSLCDLPEFSTSVLLTGSTGFLGRFILWELLQDTRITKIFCLAQNKKGFDAKERVMKIIRQLQLEFKCDSSVSAEKLVVMVGDLSEPRLGLSTDDYTTLCEEVDTIIHNGAIVNSALPYTALKNCNVESTKELIRMAVTTRPKFLHYVSSIGVFSPAQAHIDESVKPRVDQLDKLSGYSQSKWVAESLVLAAISRGKVLGNISRPGLIGPHLETGHANLQDWVYWLVKGLVKLGLVPTGHGCEGKQIYWVPVDQAAKAIALISSDHRGSVKNTEDVFHLVNSNSPIPFSALTDGLMTTHSTMKTTSYKEFRTKLAEQSRVSGDQVLGSLDLLLPREGGWPNSPVYYSEGHRVDRLQEADIDMSTLHNRYVTNYLDYLASAS